MRITLDTTAICIILVFSLNHYAKAQSPEQCLEVVAKQESMIPQYFAATTSYIQSLIPDPAAYEKTLPSREKVLASKDVLNFKNYCGLAEAYLFGGDVEKGHERYNWVASNYKTMLGSDDTFIPGLVGGDFGLYSFLKKDYRQAEPLLRQAVASLERHSSPATANNLITGYMCLTVITKHQGKTPEAAQWAKKCVDLSIKHSQQQ